MSGFRGRLIKFCREPHLPRQSNSLLIGNLEKFRDLENKEIEDAGEGTFDFSIEFSKGATIPTAWANLIFQGSFAFGDTSNSIRLPGSISAFAEYLDIEKVSGGEVTFREARATINYSSLNSFLFCCSIGHTSDPMEENPFEGYDSCWQVADSDSSLHDFSQRVASLIHQQVTLENLEGRLDGLQLAKLGQFSVQLRHGPVNYMPRELCITQETEKDFDKLVGTYLNTPFCKPLSYSSEREYRFLFSITVGDRAISVKNKDLLLELNTLFQPT